MITVYLTCRDSKHAKEISSKLLEKRLIACANIFPVKSVYRWKEKITEEEECAVFLKTLDKNFAAIQKEIEAMHRYDTPCIEKIKVEANKKYEDWVNKSVK